MHAGQVHQVLFSESTVGWCRGFNGIICLLLKGSAGSQRVSRCVGLLGNMYWSGVAAGSRQQQCKRVSM